MISDLHCVFCKIISGNAPATILFQNELILVIKDKKPVSKFHFQVIPKRHICNINYLDNEGDKLLVTKMVEIGKRTLEVNGGDASDARLGFHVPPYNTVDHLHLHVISPVSGMDLYNQHIFHPHPLSFQLVNDVLKRLHK